MSYYECKRCFYKTKYKNDMRRHLNIKQKCKKKNITSVIYNEELDIKSLEKIDLITDEPKNSDTEEKNFMCEYCSKKFSRKYNLKIHLDNICKKKENLTNNNSSNNIINNFNTVTSTTNNNIMFNILVNPYEHKFDTSHIDNLTKMDMIINIIFTKALEHILENKNNLNILVDDDHETAIVYKNDTDKFVRVKKDEFTKNVMKNMKDVLSDMNDEIEKNPYLTKRIDEIIELKYKNYIEEKKTNDMVNDMICKIYDQKKIEIQEIFKNVNKNEDIIIF